MTAKRAPRLPKGPPDIDAALKVAAAFAPKPETKALDGADEEPSNLMKASTALASAHKREKDARETLSKASKDLLAAREPDKAQAAASLVETAKRDHDEALMDIGHANAHRDRAHNLDRTAGLLKVKPSQLGRHDRTHLRGERERIRGMVDAEASGVHDVERAQLEALDALTAKGEL